MYSLKHNNSMYFQYICNVFTLPFKLVSLLLLEFTSEIGVLSLVFVVWFSRDRLDFGAELTSPFNI